MLPNCIDSIDQLIIHTRVFIRRSMLSRFFFSNRLYRKLKETAMICAAAQKVGTQVRKKNRVDIDRFPTNLRLFFLQLSIFLEIVIVTLVR